MTFHKFKPIGSVNYNDLNEHDNSFIIEVQIMSIITISLKPVDS